MNPDFYALPQIIGYIALIIYVSGYAFKDDNKLKVIFSVSNIFWIIHYYLINAQTAAVTTALITMRNLLSLNADGFSRRRKLLTAWVFTLLLVVAGVVTWNGWISLVPVCACVAATFAMIYLNALRLRQVLLLIDLTWLVHACVVVSFGGFVYALSAMAVNAVTLYRLRETDAA